MNHTTAIPESANRLLTKKDALALTNSIRAAASELWRLLLEAHDRKAWVVLGYESWRDYITSNFDMSVRRSFQVIDQGRVIRELENAAGVNHGSQTSSGDSDNNDNSLNENESISVSERSARDIKPHLPEITAEIRGRVEQGADPVQTTYEVIEAKRQVKDTPDPAPAPPTEAELLRVQFDDLQSDYNELASQFEEVVAENAGLQAVVDGNDQVNAALDEAKKYRELNRIAEERIRGLMNEKNEAIRSAKYWQRQAKKPR